MKTVSRPGFAIIVLALAASLPMMVQGSWVDRLKGTIPANPPPEEETEFEAAQPLGAEHETMVAGLKEALETGTRRAIETAGQKGGFSDNPKIAIPLPGVLQGAGGMFRGIGLGRQADEVEKSMNRAAEQAAPAGLDIIVKAIRDISIEDARAILVGPSDGATRFLRRRAGDRIAEGLRPLVADAMQQNDAADAYTTLIEQVGTRLPGIGELDDLDLNEYVTGKTLDGVFILLADEERKIREEPAARTSDLLREVFGN